MAFQPHAGALVLGIYELTRLLGRGGFGEVWEATAPGDIPKAVKMVDLDDPGNESSQLELDGLRTMRSIRHPYILSLDRFEIVDGTLFLASELAEKSLADRRQECLAAGERGLSRGELLPYMKEAAEALDYLSREHGLQHLDVKPANLFLSAGHVKVADFSVVRGNHAEMTSATMAFSPLYAAPEVFDGQVTPWCDQYSLAVTYQELLTGARPYHAPDLRSLVALHLEGRPELSLLPAADRIAVARALSREHDRRYPTCRKFVEQLVKAAFFGEVAVNLAHATPQSQRATKPARAGAKTVPAGLNHAAPASEAASTEAEFLHEGRIVEHFLAFVPLEIYARKLRGFVDEMSAEIVACSAEKIVMLLRNRGWMGLRRSKGLFLQVDAVARETRSGYRAIETAVWPTGKGWDTAELARRSRALTRLLRAYLIASDSRPLPAAALEMRAKILA